MSAELASLDGQVAPAAETTIPVTDEGFLRGDGVFEVIRVYDGVPFALREHLARLDRSTTNLRLGWSAARAELEVDVARLLEARGGSEFDGCLRIVLTRGGRRLLLTEPLPPTPEHARLAFVTFCPTRILDGIKSLSYAGNMLAGRIARERGFDEALLVTPHGRVLEAPTSTLFWSGPDGRLATPPLDEHILASITRAHVVEVTGAQERVCTRDDLRQASEAFLASTTREVQPVVLIEDVELQAPGECTRAAAAGLRERIREALAAGG
jgi:branched-subunit amino acid aminotransferase/4-amino-4-deoxychorismate lyase